jgi:glutamate-1-semialdehyde 2,1-aminomutase
VCTLGKVIGGGFPLAAFGGSAAVMDHLAPEGPVYQAGTLSGNPVAVAAALAQLGLLNDGVYDWLESVTRVVVDLFSDAFEHAGVDAVVSNEGTLAGIVFDTAAPRNYEDVRAADHERYARFFHEMLSHGVYVAPSGYEVLFTCTALDNEALERIRLAAAAAARALA